MTETINPMIELIQKFLDKHFPNDKHRVSEGGSEIFVSVGDGEMKLFFNVCGNSIYAVSIHNDYLDEISPLFGLDTYYTDSALVLNAFTAALNDNKLFNEVFILSNQWILANTLPNRFLMGLWTFMMRTPFSV